MKMIWTIVIVWGLSSAAVAMPPPPPGDTTGEVAKYFQCLSDTSMTAGMAHPEVTAVDVVSAADAKCHTPLFDFPFVYIKALEYEATRNPAIDAARDGPRMADDWREKAKAEVVGQLNAKRLGM